MSISWELFMPDGQLIEGRGQDAPGGMKLSTVAAEAAAARFRTATGAWVYIAGAADLVWTVQNIFSYGERGVAHLVNSGVKPHTKALGVGTPREGCRLWIMPNGDLGIGRSVEDIGLAWQAFNTVKR